MPTLSRKPQTTQINALQETPAPVFRRARRPEGHVRSKRRRTHLRKILSSTTGFGEELIISEEKGEIEKKIVALQKIVPGGETLDVDKLFEETAEYILTLQCQVKALRFLASFVEGSEKEKKLGG